MWRGGVQQINDCIHACTPFISPCMRWAIPPDSSSYGLFSPSCPPLLGCRGCAAEHPNHFPCLTEFSRVTRPPVVGTMAHDDVPPKLKPYLTLLLKSTSLTS
eukprot:1149058-Pelagomonas_calceolata.AAC.2